MAGPKSHLLNLVNTSRKGLDDLCVRFIINLPNEELSIAERICFQIEEAQWFYEDFIRPLDPDLPSLNLRNFCAVMFEHCHLLSNYSSEERTAAFEAFLVYKTTVPVRGAIMLNDNMDEVVLVKGWKKGANWSFPRGKIDQGELDLTCAIREVYEETGFDLKEAGLVGDEKDTKFINIGIRGQDIRLYVFRGVPMDIHFEPRTRKEISKISWHKLADLPTVKKKKQQQEGYGEELAVNANKFYMVAPFLAPLKKWINQQRRRDKAVQASQSSKATGNANLTSVESAALEQEVLDEQVHDERAEQDHLARLLHTLQQSSQAKTSDLPEVSRPAASQQVSETRNIPKSADLLALLRNGNSAASEPKPQLSFNQVIEQPPMPRSPQRNLELPPPPSFTLPTSHVQPIPPPRDTRHPPGVVTSLGNAPPHMPQVRPIPAPSQPAQLAPRSSGTHPLMHPITQARVPYQGVGDQFTRNLYPPLGPQQTSVPPASMLPQPKLTAQASGLLDLFKNGSQSVETVKASGMSQQSIEQPSTQREEKMSKPAIQFVPPQVSRTSSNSVPQTTKSPSTHQANLLHLFRTTSIPHAESKALQPPATAVELSAFPSPGHSKEPSKAVDGSPQASLRSIEPPSKPAVIQKRQNPRNASVSATVSGPLNTPQFDMIKSTSREPSGSLQKVADNPVKRSPIRILSRPSSSHGPTVDASLKSKTQPPTQSSQQKPQPPSLVTPTRPAQPPTPDLRAHVAPSKPFQPQILRRPGLSHDTGEPSPIQPLPSPQHNFPTVNRSIQPSDQKKSLLSLFTKCSPVVTPPTISPSHTLDPTSLISPLEKSATPLPQQSPAGQDDVFTPPPVGPVSKPTATMRDTPLTQARKFYAPDRMPPRLQANITTSAAADGKEIDQSGSKTAPTPPSFATTPVQKAFLLGFLADVAKSGR